MFVIHLHNSIGNTGRNSEDRWSYLFIVHPVLYEFFAFKLIVLLYQVRVLHWLRGWGRGALGVHATAAKNRSLEESLNSQLLIEIFSIYIRQLYTWIVITFSAALMYCTSPPTLWHGQSGRCVAACPASLSSRSCFYGCFYYFVVILFILCVVIPWHSVPSPRLKNVQMRRGVKATWYPAWWIIVVTSRSTSATSTSQKWPASSSAIIVSSAASWTSAKMTLTPCTVEASTLEKK